VVYWRADNDVAVAELACTLSQYDVIDKYDVISGNRGVPVGWRVWRGVWAGQQTGLACPLCQYDVIGEYDVISSKSGVPAGGQ
jgi:hypothetical protein